MFPIPFNFPFRKKDGSLTSIGDAISSGGGSYTLPTASAETKGGVKIGSGLTMDGEVLNNSNPTPYTLPTASDETKGGVKVGSGLSIDENGVLSASGGGGVSDFTLLETLTTSSNTVQIPEGAKELLFYCHRNDDPSTRNICVIGMFPISIIKAVIANNDNNHKYFSFSFDPSATASGSFSRNVCSLIVSISDTNLLTFLRAVQDTSTMLSPACVVYYR